MLMVDLIIKNNKGAMITICGNRVNNTIVVHACQMNFFYDFIIPGPILRHLGGFGKIRCSPGKIHVFCQTGAILGI
jgi:hypothetical protein